jgi:hypothetical protein
MNKSSNSRKHFSLYPIASAQNHLYISALPFNFGNLVLWNTFFFLFSEKASLLQKIAAWLSFFLKKGKG